MTVSKFFKEALKWNAAGGHAMQHASMGMRNISYSGNTFTAIAFAVDGYENFLGGSITMPGVGTWYVGVELYTGLLRVLPRLGHRGWLPIAKVVSSASAITSMKQIHAPVPKCRIPRTMAKVLAGTSINVVVMGSSLTASGGAATDWPGMVFGAGTTDKYKVPTTVSCQYTGVGGTPNQYQLAQLGYATNNSGNDTQGTQLSSQLANKSPPNGRSQLFSGVDLVVIGCLANGGDYRLQCIEPLARKLMGMGVEVMFITDNVQGPVNSYSGMTAGSLYTDGPEIFRVADLYGCEVADTAAYVFEAYIRAGGTGIYSDTIHQASGTPNGPTAATVANGHEAYARAVRGIFPISPALTTSTITNTVFDFASSVQGWSAYGTAVLTNPSGTLSASITAAASGAQVVIAVPLNIGDVVTVTYDCVITGSLLGPQVGLQNGGWAGGPNGFLAGTAQVTTLTATKVCPNTTLLFYVNGTSSSGTFTLDNITVSVNNLTALTLETTNNRPSEVKGLPPFRIATDYKTPGDMCVILPSDETFYANANPNRGTIGAHPWGTGSFARRFSSSVSATGDLLTLATGKQAVLSADSVVGFSFIHYRDVSDGACTFDVYVNGATFIVGMTIATVPFANEWYQVIKTPTDLNTSYATGVSGSTCNTIRIVVTSGTLKIAAMALLTADITYIRPEEIKYVGTWLPKEISRSGMPGFPTDTAGSYAYVRNPGRRLSWVISGNPGTQLCNTYTDREVELNGNYVGNYHMKYTTPLLSPGAYAHVSCAVANASGSQSNGHALHVGGAIAINDR